MTKEILKDQPPEATDCLGIRPEANITSESTSRKELVHTIYIHALCPFSTFQSFVIEA